MVQLFAVQLDAEYPPWLKESDADPPGAIEEDERESVGCGSTFETQKS
jgi:hypothetical protein